MYKKENIQKRKYIEKEMYQKGNVPKEKYI